MIADDSVVQDSVYVCVGGGRGRERENLSLQKDRGKILEETLSPGESGRVGRELH